MNKTSQRNKYRQQTHDKEVSLVIKMIQINTNIW